MQTSSPTSNASFAEDNECPFELTIASPVSPLTTETPLHNDAQDFLELNQVTGIVDQIQFETKLVPESSEIDQEIQRDVHLKMMEYTKHEFLKKTEVQSMINEAVQQIAERMRGRDSIITANKEWLRKVDAKVKNMDAQVATLLKLTKQVTEHHKKIKDLAGNLEQFNNNRISENDSQSIVNRKFENQIIELNIDQKRKQIFLNEIVQKNKDQDLAMQDLDRKVRKHIAKQIETVQEQINIKQLHLNQLDHVNRDYHSKFASLQEKLQIQQQKENTKMCEMMRYDNVKLLELELKVRNLNLMENKVNSIDQAVAQLIQSASKIKEVDLFNTRSLPLLIHFQVSEAVQNLVITKNQQVKVAEWDTAKLIELDSYLKCQNDIGNLRRQIDDFGKTLMESEFQTRSVPFKFEVEENYETCIEQQTIVEQVKNLKYSQSETINEFELGLEERCKSLVEKLLAEQAPVKVHQSKIIPATPREVKKQGISKLNTNNLLSKTNEEHIKTQNSILTQQSIIQQNNVRYINRFDYKRLRFIERRLRDTVNKFIQILNEKKSNYDEQIEDLQNDQEEFQTQLKFLSDGHKAISEFLVTGDKDTSKLKKTLLNQSVSEESSPAYTKNRNLSSSSSERPMKRYAKKKISESSSSISLLTPIDANKKLVAPLNDEIMKQIQNNTIQSKYIEEQMAKMNTLTDDVEKQMEQISDFIDSLKDQMVLLEQSTEQKTVEFKMEVQQQLNQEAIVNEHRAQEINKQIDRTLQEIQSTVIQRQINLENQQKAVIAKCQIADETCKEIKILFERDYQEFVKDRRRWKSDFDMATKQGQLNYESIEGLLTNCLKKNEINTEAIKMMHDVQMISQLCERQDAEDRKQIGLYGTRTDREILNHALVDNQTTKGSEDIERTDNIFGSHINKVNQVLKVDPACLQCSGNMNQVIHQLKLACLNYTSSPVPYQGKMYVLPDLLRVKGNLISECQRLIRDHLYRSKTYDGAQILKYSDERSYVIEPLLDIKKYATNQNNKRWPEILKTERLTVSQLASTNYVDTNIQQLIEKESECGSKMSDTAAGDSMILKNNYKLTENYTNNNRVVISRQSRSQMADENQDNKQKFNAFSPLNQQQILLANEQRRKSRLGSRVGQTIDAGAFATGELSFHKKIPNRPITQMGLVQKNRYDGYSYTVRGTTTPAGMAANWGTNQSLELNLEKKAKLDIKLSIDGQQIGLAHAF